MKNLYYCRWDRLVTAKISDHSLWVIAASIFEAGVDEWLIMSRTGHGSCDAVRFYKYSTEGLKQVNLMLSIVPKNVYKQASLRTVIVDIAQSQKDKDTDYTDQCTSFSCTLC